MKTISVLRLGRLDYTKALAVQEKLVRRIKESVNEGKCGENTLILVEHPPVYTTGMRTQGYSEEEELRLRNLGADFVRTKRGGLITFHGPGQLVAYPILNLRQFAPEQTQRKALLGMKWFVWSLEEMVISLLDELGVQGHRSPNTGVWVNTKHGTESKICAIGVHNSDRVTSHGIGLNCTTDLAWFDHIVPCGLHGLGVTSLSQCLGREDEHLQVAAVGERLVARFEEVFQCRAKFVTDSVKQEILHDVSKDHGLEFSRMD